MSFTHPRPTYACFRPLQVQENRYRADLTKPALARLYAVEKSLKVAKAGGKKVKAKKQLATRS